MSIIIDSNIDATDDSDDVTAITTVMPVVGIIKEQKKEQIMFKILL